ncbi:MAG: hypothetical protein ACJAWV_002894 [Flammeovirgaceae bacterium]|jgi:hypothetical protein
MNNTLKVVIGLIAVVIVGGLVFKAITIVIGVAIVAAIGYLVIKSVFPKLLKKPEEEPKSPLEKYKGKL